jgi:hypothetical protein
MEKQDSAQRVAQAAACQLPLFWKLLLCALLALRRGGAHNGRGNYRGVLSASS